MKCTALKLNGKPCQAAALTGDNKCHFHSETQREKRREAQAKGGLAKAGRIKQLIPTHLAKDAPDARLDSPQDAEEGQFRGVASAKKKAMLEAFCETGSVAGAAELSGCSPRSHFYWMADPSYVSAFAVAKLVFSEKLIQAVHTRATRQEKPSDLLLMFATKGLRPEYRDNFKPEINVNIANINTSKDQFDFEKFRTLLKSVAPMAAL